jgi:hypothetical protein
MRAVFEYLKLTDKAPQTKVDALFHSAMKRNSDTVNPTNPYPVDQLKDLMHPFIEYKGVIELWLYLLSLVSTEPLIELLVSLKDKLVAYTLELSTDPLICLSQMQTFLQENADELSLIEIVGLNSKELVSLPKKIGLFVNLNALHLAGNNLRELPEEIAQLKQLKMLNLNNNHLVKLPEKIGELKALEYLSLSNNELCSLPLEMGHLSSLQYLSIENNLLKNLPETIGNLENLKFFYLYNNRISHFPAAIGGMQSLQILSAPNNLLIDLPDEIGKLHDLQALILDNNSLSKLPDTLADLKYFEELHVNNNQLGELPKLFTLIRLGCEGNFFTPEENSIFSVSHEQFQYVYNLLGDKKWKECIDGMYHSLGKDVFDLGLHGNEVEPGFLASMLKAFRFLSDNYSYRVDASFYLHLHKISCSHFDGANTQTSVGKEGIGIFRREWVYAMFPAETCAISKKAVNQFYELSRMVSTIFGSSFFLGDILIGSNVSPAGSWIVYNKMKNEQIEMVFNLFLSEFYADISTATSDDEKLLAIAKLIQHLEWLHPVEDGCGRTDTALLNFLLTKYGFNPVLLEYPYRSSCRSLAEWTQYIKQGMQNWQNVAANKLQANT